MTEQEMIEYLRSTRLYEEHEDFFYEKEYYYRFATTFAG